MSEHLEHTAPQHGDVGYDHAEPSGRPLFLLTGIAAVTVVILIAGVTIFFNHVEEDAFHDRVLVPPSNMLVSLHEREDKQLYSYQIIDRAKGTVQLPIDRAMELVIKESGEGKLPFAQKPTVVGAEVAPAAPAAPAPRGPRLYQMLLQRNKFASALLGALLAPVLLHAVEALPQEFQGVGVDEKVGQKINLDLTFIAENGYPVALRSYFQTDKPVILNLVYYSCPMLCNRVLNGETDALRGLAWTIGKEFEVVTISIDPTEMFNLAQQKRAAYLDRYGKPTTGWHFLSDTEGHSKQLADQLGFHYKLDERTHQYAHAAAIMVLTPEGKVARYLYGVNFKNRDVRLALTEAAEGRGSFNLNKFLLICFHYDPHAKGYVLFAENLMRIGGALCALILGFVIWRLFRYERIRNHQRHLVPAK